MIKKSSRWMSAGILVFLTVTIVAVSGWCASIEEYKRTQEKYDRETQQNLALSQQYDKEIRDLTARKAAYEKTIADTERLNKGNAELRQRITKIYLSLVIDILFYLYWPIMLIFSGLALAYYKVKQVSWKTNRIFFIVVGFGASVFLGGLLFKAFSAPPQTTFLNSLRIICGLIV